MLHPHDHFTADSEVLFTQLGDNEAVLLHLTTQYYYSLNETGLAIWRGVNEGMSLGEVADAIRSEYEIDEAGAWKHVSDFVEHLKKMKLLVEAPGSVGSPG
ncbi:MAG: PqqD family protein [Rhodothermales bacterium]